MLPLQAMVKLVSEKLGQDAGSVLAAMLAHACRFETAVNVSSRLCLPASAPAGTTTRACLTALLIASHRMLASRLQPSCDAEVLWVLHSASLVAWGCSQHVLEPTAAAAVLPPTARSPPELLPWSPSLLLLPLPPPLPPCRRRCLSR